MLQVQQYLLDKGLPALEEEFKINCEHHPDLPLVILNYDQIESRPKSHPIVRECRGLVLNSQTWEIVAKSMYRFFNWGEMQEEMSLFDFSNFIVDSKEDGSLSLLYNFDGQWHGNTRSSFGLNNIKYQEFTWRDGFLKAMKKNSWNDLNRELDPSLTYICEFVSPWNKVVRYYSEPKMYLLAAFCKEKELTWDEVDQLKGPFVRPERWKFKSIDEITAFLVETQSEYVQLPKPDDEVFPRFKLVKEGLDPTFEGFVIRDNCSRWKIKSALYLSLHQMRGEGDNLYNPKYLVPWVLKGEGDELLTYFAEVSDRYYEIKGIIDEAYAKLESLWLETKDIEDQKAFALAVVGKTPFTGILFDLRKTYGNKQKLANLKYFWRNSADGIVKVLFSKKKWITR